MVRTLPADEFYCFEAGRENLPIRKVDIDVEDALARQYKITSIPCFVLIANGREINRINGATDEKTLRRMMMMLPKQSDDTSLAKNSRTSGTLIPTSNANATNPGERKLFPKIPPLFAKNQEPKLTPTNVSETVRGQSPADPTDDEYARDPLTASIRIRVKDGSRVHFGSGTIISSQSGRAIVLTCGHIFRDLGKDAVIEVDLNAAGKSKPQTVIGQVVTYDLTADLGLLEIPNSNRLSAVKMKAPSKTLSVDDRVSSVGCGGGDRPTVQEHSVTSINRYRGPDNVECTGIPQQGRSGGGLFLGSELVGVCIAADPKDKRGIYTGMKPIAQILNKAKLGHLLPSSVESEPVIADAEPASLGVLGNPVDVEDEDSRHVDDEVASLIQEATQGSGSSNAATADYVGAEVVCIVRPKTPGALSRVVIVNQASPRFVNDLLHESSGSNRSDSMQSAQRASRKTQEAKQPSATVAKASSQMAMQKPDIKQVKSDSENQTVETSFEPQRYRRKRD